ncbi:hypothetical protein OH492_18515 [Vibrio chagasii]|nr:hypothetical protein [Vibrio chagasii]
MPSKLLPQLQTYDYGDASAGDFDPKSEKHNGKVILPISYRLRLSVVTLEALIVKVPTPFEQDADFIEPTYWLLRSYLQQAITSTN